MNDDKRVGEKADATKVRTSATRPNTNSKRELGLQEGHGWSTTVAGRAMTGRLVRRRGCGLSEIDAEIRTLEGEFANVIYLATER